MPSFPPTTDELFEEFNELEDWDERYDLIIDLGRELPTFPVEAQTEENIVKGCMSTVWLTMNVIGSESGKTVELQADSDSIIVKGLIVLLLAFYNQKSLEQIVQEDVKEFFGELGLNQHLSPQRRNGLYSMVKRLKQLATEQLAN